MFELIEQLEVGYNLNRLHFDCRPFPCYRNLLGGDFSLNMKISISNRETTLLHGKENHDLYVQPSWLGSNFETFEEFLEDTNTQFRANDLILEGKAIVEASFMTCKYIKMIVTRLHVFISAKIHSGTFEIFVFERLRSSFLGSGFTKSSVIISSFLKRTPF